RDEEETEQQPLERLDRGLDLVAVLRLGEQHAGEKGAERHRQPGRLVGDGDAEHEQQRESGEDLAQPRARDVAEHRAHHVVVEESDSAMPRMIATLASAPPAQPSPAMATIEPSTCAAPRPVSWARMLHRRRGSRSRPMTKSRNTTPSSANALMSATLPTTFSP